MFTSDEGILTEYNQVFFYILTLKDFQKMIKLIASFCKKESKGYQYVYDIDNPT
ncbi:hypothetical protein [Polaribacter glomeratus]|uniref:hypothetical protein n=1 Tax=Polaribacter glomeratus TaxID=102 RepID=UPI00147305A3|nr:hypothetical protein [Polaribacter glomeratus]